MCVKKTLFGSASNDLIQNVPKNNMPKSTVNCKNSIWRESTSKSLKPPLDAMFACDVNQDADKGAMMRLSSLYSRKNAELNLAKQTNEEQRKWVPERSLYGSLKWILVIAQILGQMPVSGIAGEGPKCLQFKWKTWRMAFCLISLGGTIFFMIILLFKMIQSGTNLFIIETFIFHACKLGTTLSFLYLAKRWPKLMKDWMNVETHFQSYGWPNGFDFKIRLITVIILTLAITQYITNQITNMLLAAKCKTSEQNFMEYFYEVLSFPYVFSLIDYAGWKGFLLHLVDLQTSLVWCYVDLFIMVMSTSLAVRFQQVTERVKITADSKVISENTWRNVREDYNRLCKLCKVLDESMSNLILMSFGTNLFFILLLLFNSLREMKNSLYKIYFFASFGFLIGRTVYVSLYAAWVNDESKMPISILNSVPTSVYNIEIRRFIQQISFDSVALTGRNFFNVTRGLILSVAGAIVTYELVLIQFNENLLKNKNTTDECTFKI